MTVVAEDGGGRAGTGTVTIYVDDDNDMAPVFKKKIFRKTMSEGEPSGTWLWCGLLYESVKIRLNENCNAVSD